MSTSYKNREYVKEINLLIGNCPFYGDQLVDQLIEQNVVSSIYFSRSSLLLEDIYRKNTNRVKRFAYTVARDANYEFVCDLNQLPALSRELLEQMLPYESMALKLGRRREQFPTTMYEEEKIYYHKHLRFWNYIFDKYAINAVYYDEFPHGQYEYIIYALAKIKHIPMLLASMTSIPGIRVYGHSMETVGDNVRDYFLSNERANDNEYQLIGRIAEYYNKYTMPVEQIDAERKNQHFFESELKRTTKYLYGKYLGWNGLFRLEKERIRTALSAILKHHDWNWYTYRKAYLEQIQETCYRARYFMHHQAMTQKEYNKIAVEPDYTKKYIYFGLQLTPEETTEPRAGVFAEQYTSIQLLARAAEKVGVMIYVKEHFVQPFRNKEIYRMLKNIPNVKLIKTTVSSFRLMEHCIAVSTQTGTCILEGALRGKPALVIGRGYNWKGLPTLFEIINENQGAEVIQSILDGFYIDPKEVKRYFYAIQMNSIEVYLTPNFKNMQGLEYDKSLQAKVMLIRNFVKQITEENF